MNDLHFILGGMRSGKSHHAQQLAAQSELQGLQVVVLATALAADAEMGARIERHRADRPAHWHTVEVAPTQSGLAEAIRAHAADDVCLLIDCLTLWVSQLVCPPPGVAAVCAEAAADAALRALAEAPGRAIVVSNEIGLGVVPMDAGTRQVVDELGRLHQRLAAQAQRVSWMVAGLAVSIKGGVS